MVSPTSLVVLFESFPGKKKLGICALSASREDTAFSVPGAVLPGLIAVVWGWPSSRQLILGSHLLSLSRTLGVPAPSPVNRIDVPH